MKGKMKSARREKYEDFLKRYFSHKMGVLGIIIAIFFIVMAAFPKAISTHDPKEYGTRETILIPPNGEHLLGTDDVGKDVFSQLVYGSRVSMLIGLFAGGTSTIIGALIGLISGYYGGKLDQLIMRFVDILMVLPGIAIMLVLAAVLGPSLWNIIMVIAILGWTGTARIVRSQVLSVKEKPYVEAAKCIGANELQLMIYEILPNVLPIIFSQTMMSMSDAIYSEAVLSFLGLGDPLHISWGIMLHFAFASGAIRYAWWLAVPPGLCIAVLVLGFTFTGSALNEILNPRYRSA
jgi:peptide/nickel transport system permease protein